MSRDEIKGRVLAILGAIAPEADLGALDPQADLREQIDLDSMDFLSFAARISKELGVDVPQEEMGRLVTLDGTVDYLAGRVGAA